MISVSFFDSLARIKSTFELQCHNYGSFFKNEYFYFKLYKVYR